MSGKPTRRSSWILLALLALGLRTTALAAFTTVYTTDPSYTVTLSGMNNENNAAQWTDGGHVRRETVTGMGFKSITFSTHV
jgi:hypothetical protein